MSTPPRRAAVPAAPPEDAFVSRGGDKLDAALTELNVDVTGRRALDAGASTGGFTDVLLRRGAAHVVAVDVAYGAFAWRLRNDKRVTLLERTNVRTLTNDATGEPIEIAVADLAFISLCAVADAIAGVCTTDAVAVLLVKPQFEAARGQVERGGVVRDPAVWSETMHRVALAWQERGFTLRGACPSPLIGPAGNREFFLHLVRDGQEAHDDVIAAAIGRAP